VVAQHGPEDVEASAGQGQDCLSVVFALSAVRSTRSAAGDLHHQALRALGHRLVGILHGCLRHHTHYGIVKLFESGCGAVDVSGSGSGM
jgi:hypothetical protein